MAKAKAPKANEVKFAYNLLRDLHANLNNGYLLRAIIAWVRSESGSNYIGNNPLNLRPGADDAKLRSGIRLAKNGNGRFSIYKDLVAAAQATANRLLRVKGAGYDLMVAAAQRGTGTTNAEQQKQAIDFMYALVISKWDAGHYGVAKANRPDPNSVYTTTLYSVWAKLTGQAVTIPADVVSPPAKVKPKPVAPKYLQPPPPPMNYVSAVTARAFYEERHKPQRGDPGDPSATGL